MCLENYAYFKIMLNFLGPYQLASPKRVTKKKTEFYDGGILMNL